MCFFFCFFFCFSIISEWQRGRSTPPPSLSPGAPCPPGLCPRSEWTSLGAEPIQMFVVHYGPPSCRRRRRGRSCHYWKSVSASSYHSPTKRQVRHCQSSQHQILIKWICWQVDRSTPHTLVGIEVNGWQLFTDFCAFFLKVHDDVYADRFLILKFTIWM